MCLTMWKKNAMRLIELGFEYPKFSKVMSQLYAETGDDVFLIAETRGIFLFWYSYKFGKIKKHNK